MSDTNMNLLAISQEHRIAAAVIFMISMLGVLCNTLVAMFTRGLVTMNNPFGRLTASQSTGEAVLCAIFAFYYVPMVYFDIITMKRWSPHAGMILLMCYDICIMSHLCIALNRMCAICFPMKYEVFFSYRNTTVLIIMSWLLSIFPPLYLYGYVDCGFIYDDSIWTFVFRKTETCAFISWYIDFYKDISIVIVIAIVDTITVIQVHLTSAEILRSGSRIAVSRRAQEVNFLKQAVAQGAIFVVELFTYFLLAWKFENRWIIWILTTLAWNIVHCSDALITIVFNKEFRRLICTPFQKNNGGSSALVQPTVTVKQATS